MEAMVPMGTAPAQIPATIQQIPEPIPAGARQIPAAETPPAEGGGTETTPRRRRMEAAG